jgi:hypothetical protein
VVVLLHVRSAQRELLELWRRVLAPGSVTAGPLCYASCADEVRAASNEARAVLDLFPPATDARGCQGCHA